MARSDKENQFRAASAFALLAMQQLLQDGRDELLKECESLGRFIRLMKDLESIVEDVLVEADQKELDPQHPEGFR